MIENTQTMNLGQKVKMMKMAPVFHCKILAIAKYCLIYRYCDGKPPRGYIDPDQISWMRPEEFAPDHDA